MTSATASIKQPITQGPAGPGTLDIRAPQRLGLLAIASALMLGVAASLVELDQGPVVIASGHARAEPETLRHAAGGTIARIHVASGATVAAGALLVSLDTRGLDNQIASLKLLSEATTMKLTAVRQMAAALAAVGQANTQSGNVRTRLATLEQEVAETETEAIGVQTRIMVAEQERTRTDIRAPLAGRVVDLGGHAEGSVIAQNGVIARVLPRADQLRLDPRWPASTAVTAGQPVRVWQDGPWALLPALSTIYIGRIEIASSETPAAQPLLSRVAVEIGGTDLADRPASGAALKFQVQLIMGRQSLWAHLWSPLFRASTVP